MATAFGWACRVVTWLVLLSSVAALVAAVLLPRLAGATPYTVLTGSMRPQMPPGTLVVVRPRSTDAIGVGDVVTFQLRSGQPDVVTHRVIAQGYDGTGERVFRTRGDANPAPDVAWVRAVQIRGTAWYHVPWLGYLSVALTGAQRGTLIWIVALLLIGYAALMWLSAARDRARR